MASAAATKMLGSDKRLKSVVALSGSALRRAGNSNRHRFALGFGFGEHTAFGDADQSACEPRKAIFAIAAREFMPSSPKANSSRGEFLRTGAYRGFVGCLRPSERACPTVFCPWIPLRWNSFGFRTGIRLQTAVEAGDDQDQWNYGSRDEPLVVLRKSLTTLTVQGYDPAFLLLNPTDWETIELALSPRTASEHQGLPYDAKCPKGFSVFPSLFSNAGCRVSHAVGQGAYLVSTWILVAACRSTGRRTPPLTASRGTRWLRGARADITPARCSARARSSR